MTLVVGLTGGIGSGKSAAADMFASHGIPVIDTDILAREVVEPNSAALQSITTHFGHDVIKEDGHLDRKALAQKVFANPAQRQWREKLLHPKIRALAAKKIHELNTPYCILVIPLLVENLPNPLVNRILVVDCPESQQIIRVQERDNHNPEQIQAIMDSQATRQQRLDAADDVIFNDKDLSHLSTQVDSLHEIYMKNKD